MIAHQIERFRVEHGAGCVQRLCDAAGLSRATFYRLRHAEPSAGETDTELRAQIHAVALQWPQYGYRRITAELRRRGVVVNHKRVLRLMRSDNLLCLRRRQFVPTTDSDHRLAVYPNLAGTLDVTGTDQLWVADLTGERYRLAHPTPARVRLPRRDPRRLQPPRHRVVARS
jgi:transposase InsO family protein